MVRLVDVVQPVHDDAANKVAPSKAKARKPSRPASAASTAASRPPSSSEAVHSKLSRLQLALKAAAEQEPQLQTADAKWGQVLEVVAPPKKYGQLARDMHGREHDLVELREQRYKAVVKGLKHMYKFFKRDRYAALYELGDDAPSIFFECWYTSANSSIRMMSKDMCKKLMPAYEAWLLKGCGYVPPPPPAGYLPPPPKSRPPATGARLEGAARLATLAQPSRTRTRLMQVLVAAGDTSRAGSSGGGDGGGDAGSKPGRGTAAVAGKSGRALMAVLDGQRSRSPAPSGMPNMGRGTTAVKGPAAAGGTTSGRIRPTMMGEAAVHASALPPPPSATINGDGAADGPPALPQPLRSGEALPLQTDEDEDEAVVPLEYTDDEDDQYEETVDGGHEGTSESDGSDGSDDDDDDTDRDHDGGGERRKLVLRKDVSAEVARLARRTLRAAKASAAKVDAARAVHGSAPAARGASGAGKTRGGRRGRTTSLDSLPSSNGGASTPCAAPTAAEAPQPATGTVKSYAAAVGKTAAVKAGGNDAKAGSEAGGKAGGEAAGKSEGGDHVTDGATDGAVAAEKNKDKASGSKAKPRPTQRGGSRPDRDDFFAMMFLARCKNELGEETDALLETADKAWKLNGFEDTDKLFGYTQSQLTQVSFPPALACSCILTPGRPQLHLTQAAHTWPAPRSDLDGRLADAADACDDHGVQLAPLPQAIPAAVGADRSACRPAPGEAPPTCRRRHRRSALSRPARALTAPPLARVQVVLTPPPGTLSPCPRLDRTTPYTCPGGVDAPSGPWGALLQRLPPLLLPGHAHGLRAVCIQCEAGPPPAAGEPAVVASTRTPMHMHMPLPPPNTCTCPPALACAGDQGQRAGDPVALPVHPQVLPLLDAPSARAA